MATYKLTIAYDGTAYMGWQIQSHGPSIQGLIEQKLHILCKQSIRLVGAGRTDAGVHACGQVAHFHLPQKIDKPTILRALNTLLPRDIQILSIESVPSNFHARFSAHSKIYHYYLCSDPIPLPFHYRYHYHFPHPLDINLLHTVSKEFIGTKDFAAFANKSTSLSNNNRKKSTKKTIYQLEILKQKDGFCFIIEGSGFLYKMVRNIVGILLKVGTGVLHQDAIAQLLMSKNRQEAPAPAPAKGLFLMQVNYNKETSKTSEPFTRKPLSM